jgi:hypothetical protein
MKGFFSKIRFPKSKKNINKQNFLLITTSGGGGHLQAAQAKKNELFAKYPNSIIIEKNIVETAGGRCLGKFMIDFIWNSAQRKGSVLALNLCAYSIPLFDVLFWIPVFFQIYHLLKKHDIDHVIDTQPMATSSIATATYLYKKLFNKELLIEKVLTELPTVNSSHYLSPIKRLCLKNRNLIRLLTTTPLLGNYKTEQDFWLNQAGLRLDQVIHRSLPIRPSFIKMHSFSKKDLEILIQLKDSSEKLLIENLLGSKATFENLRYRLKIRQQDYVVTLMLGSQPPQEASLSYVKSFIAFVKNFTNHANFWFFVFCSDKKFEPIPLQQQISSLIAATSNFPENLSIIPMSSQNDSVIAPLYFRSQATITKAGGITSMELLHTAQGQIWIHYEKPRSWQKLLEILRLATCKGMPKWEYGNVLYLQNKKQAALMTPEDFYANCLSYFSSRGSYLLPQELKQNPSKILSSHEA